MWIFINVSLFVVAIAIIVYAVKYKNGTESYEIYSYVSAAFLIFVVAVISSIIKLVVG